MPRAKPTHVKVYILVRGPSSGQIFDMLRYDSACPADGQNAALLEGLMYPGASKLDRSRWIILARFVLNGNRKEPEVARWRSFGWECDGRAFDDFGTAADVARVRNAEIERSITS